MNSNEIIDSFMQSFLTLKEDLQKKDGTLFKSDLVDSAIENIFDGKYVITNDIWSIDEIIANDFFHKLLDLVGETAPDFESSVKILKKLSKKSDYASSFITMILENRQKELTAISTENDLSMDFLTFIAIFAAYPYREAVSAHVTGLKNLEDHYSGFCPVCGHWPGMSYLVGKDGGKRVMACVNCGTQWQFKRVKCNFCLSEEKESLSYLHVEGENSASAYVCDSCKRYLKVIRVEGEKLEFPKETVLVDYMSTGFLDIAAMQNQYIQESVLGTRFEGPGDKKINDHFKGHTLH